MSRRNVIALILIVISFILLIPGLTLPLITIEASIDPFGTGNPTEIFSETRSILTTVEGLHESGNDFVAGLILLFSIVVPFAKGILLLVALGVRRFSLKARIHRFVNGISKWSMADVFVVGVFVAYLAVKATDNLDAAAHTGFYFFAAYCLVSVLSAQFLRIEPPDAAASEVKSA